MVTYPSSKLARHRATLLVHQMPLPLCQNLRARVVFLTYSSWQMSCPVWPRGNFPLSFHFPIFYSIFYYLLLRFFPFWLHLFSCFFIPSHSTSIVPLCFQAGCHRRRLNIARFFTAKWYPKQLLIDKLHVSTVFCNIKLLAFTEISFQLAYKFSIFRSWHNGEASQYWTYGFVCAMAV